MNLLKITNYAVISFCLLLATPTWAITNGPGNGPNQPFVNVNPIKDRSLPPQAKAGTGMLMAMKNSKAFEQRSWSIEVPRAGRLVAERQKQNVSKDGRTVNWMGKIKGAGGGMVSITKRGDVVNGFIDDGERYWVLESAGKKRYRLFEIDMSQTPTSAHPPNEDILNTDLATDDSFIDSATVEPAGTLVIQDLLIVYSPETVARYGGKAETEVAIENYVAAVNQMYANSQVDIQMNLVGTLALSQNQSGSMGTTLNRLGHPSDGYYDEVHAMRDNLGADMVAMLTTETGYCGIAYINHPYKAGTDRNAFSVTSAYSGYGCLPLTLGHEMGHNQGLCHDRAQGCSNPAYPYGFGYRICGDFRTVMSYSCTGERRIYNFANPNVNYTGVPTGIAHAVDPSNSSEAARALNDSAADVANWRNNCSLVDLPVSPTLNPVAVVSNSELDISFIDNSDNEAGFEIYRSTDNQNWIKVTSVAANPGVGGTINYSDTMLLPATTYYYAVRSVNCLGTSIDSNIESNTTSELNISLPYLEDFEDGMAQYFTETSPDWTVNGGVYEVDTTLKPSLAVFAYDVSQHPSISIEATVEGDPSGAWQNGFIIFDYSSPTDYKFAGGFIGADKWRIGNDTGNGLRSDIERPEVLETRISYHVQLIISGSVATLYVDGVEKLSHDYGTNIMDGNVGLGVTNAHTRFDNFRITTLGSNQAPSASFTYSTDNLTAYFTDTSIDNDGNIVSWSWDFGDGQVSSVQHPSHSYAAPGDYTVVLTVTDNDGETSTTTQTITTSGINISLPYLENFEDGMAQYFTETSPDWTVNGGVYEVDTTLRPSLAVFDYDVSQHSSISIEATVEGDPSGAWQNGFIVFDYSSPTDYKFAGGFFGADQWRMGHDTGDGVKGDVYLPEVLETRISYHVQLIIRGSVATLYVDGVEKLSHDYGTNIMNGGIGLGVTNAHTRFDNFRIDLR